MTQLDQTLHRLSISFSLFCVHALRSLARNKLRSVLAAISIMIGIGAVVCVVAIGRAGSKRAEDALQSLGDNFVWIEAGSRAPSGVRTGSHGTTSLTVEDALAIARDVPSIKRSACSSVSILRGSRRRSIRSRCYDMSDRAAASSTSSRPRGPTTCTPIGRPAGPLSSGSETQAVPSSVQMRE